MKHIRFNEKLLFLLPKWNTVYMIYTHMMCTVHWNHDWVHIHYFQWDRIQWEKTVWREKKNKNSFISVTMWTVHDWTEKSNEERKNKFNRKKKMMKMNKKKKYCKT